MNSPVDKSSTKIRRAGRRRASRERLTDEGLVALLKAQHARFSIREIFLSTKEQGRLQKCTELVAQQPATIGKNAPRKRARMILVDLWNNFPDVFFLCSTATSLDTLGTMTSMTYLTAISDWWSKADRLPAVRTAIRDHSGLLPGPPPFWEIRAAIPSDELFNLVATYYGKQELQVIFAFDGLSLPTVNFRDERLSGKMEFSIEFGNEILSHVISKQAEEEQASKEKVSTRV